MNLIEYYLPYKIIDETNNQIFGKLRFFKEKSELTFYDKQNEEILKEELKEFSYEENISDDKKIVFCYKNKNILIYKEKDLNSRKVFCMLQNEIFKLSTQNIKFQNDFRG